MIENASASRSDGFIFLKNKTTICTFRGWGAVFKYWMRCTNFIQFIWNAFSNYTNFRFLPVFISPKRRHCFHSLSGSKFNHREKRRAKKICWWITCAEWKQISWRIRNGRQEYLQRHCVCLCPRNGGTKTKAVRYHRNAWMRSFFCHVPFGYRSTTYLSSLLNKKFIN